eukprot:TRINITY_DN29806_c0_g1_i1.p2 TRINITY_DN29806_c0_g1~~TRINITY_DN29806_c0_g1_i1.p2  ORF type:complete len:176 (+),score=23.92 TRINITY_DN29806_c0_g1_i1:338-865(+)
MIDASLACSHLEHNRFLERIPRPKLGRYDGGLEIGVRLVLDLQHCMVPAWEAAHGTILHGDVIQRDPNSARGALAAPAIVLVPWNCVLALGWLGNDVTQVELGVVATVSSNHLQDLGLHRQTQHPLLPTLVDVVQPELIGAGALVGGLEHVGDSLLGQLEPSLGQELVKYVVALL